jgi:predicted neuraminidase
MDKPNASSGRGVGHYLVLGLVVIGFAAAAGRLAHLPPAALFLPARKATVATGISSVTPARNEAVTVALRGDFVSNRKLVHAHAANLIELGSGKIRAFWFAGTDEGTQDVTIQTAVFDPERRQWSPERTVATREDTQRALFRYVKKLGNPVAARAFDGSLRLFYVTVSLGGWSGSSITTMISHDDGETWGPPRRLITSPFFNQSTLVKGMPFAYADGTLGLPVHHELMGKFGELLHLDASGAVIDKRRLSSGRFGLQPVVMVQDANRALVLMRYAGSAPPKRVIRTSTADAGLSWTAPVKSMLSNSNAALTGLALPDGRLLVALNDSEENRDTLSLAVSSDGGVSWRTVFKVEDQAAANAQYQDDAHYSASIERLARDTDGGASDATIYSESVMRQMHSANGYSFEFSYPCLLQTSRGEFHLVYTWNEAFIKHVAFSQAWLDQRSK